MTRPVMPTDETFDYLPTQAIADYLANERKLDGIIYSSAQVQGEHTNVVLFHEASRVEPPHLPEGTEVTVHLEHFGEDGPEADYMVWEKVPSQPVKKPERKDVNPILDLYEVDEILAGNNPRRATLRLDLESFEVHHVDSVSVIATAFPVRRHRIIQPGG
jgi:hypothetical protein